MLDSSPVDAVTEAVTRLAVELETVVVKAGIPSDVADLDADGTLVSVLNVDSVSNVSTGARNSECGATDDGVRSNVLQVDELDDVEVELVVCLSGTGRWPPRMRRAGLIPLSSRPAKRSILPGCGRAVARLRRRRRVLVVGVEVDGILAREVVRTLWWDRFVWAV